MVTDIDALADTVETVKARILDRERIVWVLQTTTKHGEYVEVFKTEDGARNEAIRWWREQFELPDGIELDENAYGYLALMDLLNGETSAGIDGGYWVWWEEQVVRD